MATAHGSGEVGCEGDSRGVPAGAAPDASEDVGPQASGVQQYPVALSHPALRAAECHRTSGWLGARWSTLRANVSFGRIAG